MRLLDIFSRHPRDDISARADGELASERRGALEAHLAGCELCRAELDELLAVRSALRGLPQVAAPRSFTLTQAMVERKPPPVTSRATPAFVAMRLAGAGFAAVLAVVVMLDAGGIVDDTGSRSSSDEATSLGFFESDPANRDAGTTDGSFTEAAGAPAARGDSDLPVSGGDGGGAGAVPNNSGGIGGPDGSEDAPDGDDAAPALNGLSDDGGREPPGVPSTSGDLNEIAGDDGEATAPEPGEGAATAFTSEDDGVSSLLVIEIGLAAIAVLAIGASFVIRRRADSD